MDFMNLITNIGGLLLGASVSIFIAIKESRRRKIDQQKILDLEKAMISYSYIKDKAFILYNNGNYNESLDVFKKYLSNNKDEKAWNEIINQIFRKETEKIYSGVFSFKESHLPTISLLVQAYISLEDKFTNSSQYPVLLKTIIIDYNKMFDKDRISQEFIITFFDKDWNKAKKLLPKITMLKDEEINKAYKDFVLKYLNNKLGITDDSFVDDIPF